MVSILSQIPLVGRLIPSGSSGSEPAINLPSVTIHRIDTSPDKPARTLKHLLKANHANHSILYHDLEFDNHMVHVLSSAYLLGGTPEHLHRVYAAEAASLEPWPDSPQEIVLEDWREFLGDKRYQRAYVDFFEDTLASHAYSYDWKKVVGQFMFEGEEPLVSGLIGGLGHPLIHLGYAYEMDSKEIAMEALAMAATQYNFLHKYTDDKSYTKPSSFGSTSPTELLDKLAADKRLDGMFNEPGYQNIQPIFDKHEALLLEYWNAWKLDDPQKQFEDSQEAAVALLVATIPNGAHSYNFFVVHLLTTSHAVRILLPLIPSRFQLSLVRQWWLLVLAVYLAELRPKIDPDLIPKDLKGRTWSYVEYQALHSGYAADAHYVKAIRAMREAATTWGDIHQRYLASALRFVDDFRGWVH